MVDRDTWTPPEAPARAERRRVPGAMGGSLLLDQPRYAAQKARIVAFVQRGGPLGVEVGFDHGITLVSQARAQPDWRWLGLELRRRRVAAVQPHVPDNCLAERLDARALLASGLLDGQVDRVDVLFATPALKGRHLLWTPAFVADLGRALRPSGVLHAATDVPALAAHIEGLLAAWPEAAVPPLAPEPSRRERVCARDGVAIWRRAWGRPGG